MLYTLNNDVVTSHAVNLVVIGIGEDNLSTIRHMVESDDGMLIYLFFLLTIAMVFDWLTGTITAYMLKKQSSKIGINGLLKKCLIFITAIMIILCSIIIPQGTLFTFAVLIGLILMQLQSILENLQKVNLKESFFLKKLIDLISKINNK